MTCSGLSRDRGDPLSGTGSRGLSWFLVEVSGSWGHSAFLNSPATLDPALGRQLVKRIEAAGMRPLAIRRPGRSRDVGRWRWAFVDCRPGHEVIRWGEVTAPHELLDVPLDGSTGRVDASPIVAVCTHGKHDQCCAVRGRRVLPALISQYGDQTWECSHLGGDRFAGTMIVFPHGLYYGRVDDSDVLDIVDRYQHGRVSPQFLRGRSSLPSHVQAAQHHARMLLDDDRIDSFAPISAVHGPDRWTIELAHDDAVVHVELRESMSAPITSTCDAVAAGSVRLYHLDGISVSSH